MKNYRKKVSFSIFVLVALFILPNLTFADFSGGMHTNYISPNYPIYCPHNASGDGRHQSPSSFTKAKINGTTYNAHEWECTCGAKVITVWDLGTYYFYPNDAVWTHTPGFPYVPGSYQYWDVKTLHSGDPIDWKFPY